MAHEQQPEMPEIPKTEGDKDLVLDPKAVEASVVEDFYEFAGENPLPEPEDEKKEEK
jgi:hypothetical protein